MPKMPTLIYCIVLIAVCFVALALPASAKSLKPQAELDLTQVVEAIRQVENWDGRSTGAAGEKGPWQFTRDAWFEHSTKPFWMAEGRSRDCMGEQHRVAMARVDRISSRIAASHIDFSTYSIALVFTCGYEGAKRGKPSRQKRDYAQRVQNIYDQLTKARNPTNP